MKTLLRRANPTDAPRLSEIYRPYVESSSVTLEYDAPSADEFADRIREYTKHFPYLVCECDDRIIGYAYAHQYKVRRGYRFCAELSVYVDMEYRGMGIGKRLYGALIELLTQMGYKNLYGIVTDPNPSSFALHKSFGFRETGREHLAGYKHGIWRDVVLFEYLIEDRANTDDLGLWQTEPIPFDRLGSASDEIIAKYSK